MDTNLFSIFDEVVITTGSGRGLGRTIAYGLAAFGAKIVVCDIAVEEAKQTAEQINLSGGTAAAMFVDITSKQSCEDLLEFALAKYGKINVLVNNAAIDIIEPFEQVEESNWDKVLDVDLKGNFFVFATFR